MIVPDINILVHAYNAEAFAHRTAKEWWERTLQLARPVGLPLVTVLGFIRIMTGRRVLRTPMRPEEAIRRVRSWLALPHVEILTPGETHCEILFGLLEQLGTGGDLTTDAHLAALAIEYQAELVSTNSDFARFRGLRWFNPTEVR